MFVFDVVRFVLSTKVSDNLKLSISKLYCSFAKDPLTRSKQILNEIRKNYS